MRSQTALQEHESREGVEEDAALDQVAAIVNGN